MRISTPLLTAAVTAALAATPFTAHAAETDQLSRSVFDWSAQRTASSLHIDGATSGPLGGFLDVTVTAVDGTLPTGSNTCEAATVAVALTIAPGEVLSGTVPGEACTGFSGNLTVNAYASGKDLAYSGTSHRKAKIVGDALIAAAPSFFPGTGQASFSGTVKWY